MSFSLTAQNRPISMHSIGLENWIEEETGRVTLKLTDCRISIEKQHKDLVDDSHLVVPKNQIFYLREESWCLWRR